MPAMPVDIPWNGVHARVNDRFSDYHHHQLWMNSTGPGRP
jgi:hypothetical protein